MQDMDQSGTPGRRWPVMAGVLALLAVLSLQLLLFVRSQSQTWDEGDHLYAGYMSWKTGDFGLNPEHPPLVKLLAAAPLLGSPLKLPGLQGRYFKTEAFLGGKEFVFGNDADSLLLRARLAASLLALLLALLAFLAAREMFGATAGFVALVLLVFDPNLLAHGAFVTTDVGLSCFMFAAVYAFYRYVKAPSPARLLLVALAAGLALATKHTGVLVFPMLGLLALTELVPPAGGSPLGATPGRRAWRLAGALGVVAVLAVVILWAFYGFRYAARPDGLDLVPPLAQWVGQAPKPHQAALISLVARLHLLPESYLYGLADVLFMNSIYTSFALGKVYPHGVWFYFPIAFAIKSTLTFLVLPLLVVAALVARRLTARREVLFLALPPLLHLGVAMSSRMNIGVRHILPLYVFLAVLGAGALVAFLRRDRRWRYAIAVLLVLQVATSLRAFPTYMAYSNEFWGGPKETYKYLTDSNSDWGQQLKSLKHYLDARDVKECWFAYFAQGTVDLDYYGIPCRPLPTLAGFWLGDWREVPPVVDGPVVISAGILSGYEFGPGPLNPYRQFLSIRPSAQIDGGLFVFDGRFQIPLASALALAQSAQQQLEARRPEGALAKAEQAVALAPDDLRTKLVLGDALAALGRGTEARLAYEKALRLARTVEAGFQGGRAPMLRERIVRLSSP